jgi:hypothetical protein
MDKEKIEEGFGFKAQYSNINEKLVNAVIVFEI